MPLPNFKGKGKSKGKGSKGKSGRGKGVSFRPLRSIDAHISYESVDSTFNPHVVDPEDYVDDYPYQSDSPDTLGDYASYDAATPFGDNANDLEMFYDDYEEYESYDDYDNYGEEPHFETPEDTQTPIVA